VRVLAPLALLFAVGCASTNTRHVSASSHAHVIYRSEGTINLARAYADRGGERIAVVEYLPGPGETNLEARGDGKLRLVSIGLDGRIKVAWEKAAQPGAGLGALVGVGPQGQLAWSEMAWSGVEMRCRLQVSGPWRPVTNYDDSDRVLLAWSPDGASIAYRRRTYLPGGKGRSDVVAGVVPPDRQLLTERAVAGPLAGDFAWSADSQHIYVVSSNEAKPRDGVILEDVSWPSLCRRLITRAQAIGPLTVAQVSGDLVFVSGERKSGHAHGPLEEGVTLWRVSRSGALTKTPVKLKQVPFDAVISPAGDRLAVLRQPSPEDRQSQSGLPTFRSGGLLVYSGSDGKERAVGGFEGKVIQDLAWVQGGKSLVLVEGRRRLWLVPVAALGG